MALDENTSAPANPHHGASHHSAPHHSADFHAEGDDYLEKRTLRKGSAGWVLLAGLGVSYVISGDYAGWNNGLGRVASAAC